MFRKGLTIRMHAPKKPARRKRGNAYGKQVIRWLICCFPAGLLMMWSNRCRWPRGIKFAVSGAFCALILAVIIPQTLPPTRAKGGVEIVSLSPALEIQGPVQQLSDEGEYEVYIPAYVQPTSLLVAPTPTPEPIYVYCNDGGRYYHAKNCRYVRKRKTTARVPLTQALNAGYTRCSECNAPKEDY